MEGAYTHSVKAKNVRFPRKSPDKIAPLFEHGVVVDELLFAQTPDHERLTTQVGVDLKNNYVALQRSVHSAKRYNEFMQSLRKPETYTLQPGEDTTSAAAQKKVEMQGLSHRRVELQKARITIQTQNTLLDNKDPEQKNSIEKNQQAIVLINQEIVSLEPIIVQGYEELHSLGVFSDFHYRQIFLTYQLSNLRAEAKKEINLQKKLEYNQSIEEVLRKQFAAGMLTLDKYRALLCGEKLLSEYIEQAKQIFLNSLHTKYQDRIARFVAMFSSNMIKRMPSILFSFKQAPGEENAEQLREYVKNSLDKATAVLVKICASDHIERINAEGEVQLMHTVLNQILFDHHNTDIIVGFGGSEDDLNPRAPSYIIPALQTVNAFVEAGVRPPRLRLFNGQALAVQINKMDANTLQRNADRLNRFLQAFIQKFYPQLEEYIQYAVPTYEKSIGGNFRKEIEYLSSFEFFSPEELKEAKIRLELLRATKHAMELVNTHAKNFKEFLDTLQNFENFQKSVLFCESSDTRANLKKYIYIINAIRAIYKNYSHLSQEQYSSAWERVLSANSELQTVLNEEQNLSVQIALTELAQRGMKHGNEDGQNGARFYAAAHTYIFGNIQYVNAERAPNAVIKMGGAGETNFNHVQTYLAQKYDPHQVGDDALYRTNAPLHQDSPRPIYVTMSIGGHPPVYYSAGEHEVSVEEASSSSLQALIQHYAQYADTHKAADDLRAISEIVSDQKYINFLSDFVASEKKELPTTVAPAESALSALAK